MKLIDKLLKFIKSFFMSIKVLRARWIVKDGKEIKDSYHYKKDADKKADKLKKAQKLETDKFQKYRITGPELKNPKPKIKEEVWQYHEDRKKPAIKFPESWIDRGKKRIFKQPTEFIKDLNLPMPHTNLVPANSKVQWISSRQIKEYINDRKVTMEFVRKFKGNWKADEYYRYFVSYGEACKIVEKFKK